MAQLAPGVELAGRFRLQRLLGRGGSAEVWAASDNTTGTNVALRILVTPDEVSAASLVVGLQADAGRVGRLAHPGIVRPLAVATDGGLACVALELADCGDLGALRGASHQSIVAAVREVADALQYVHAQGLTHGDLKAGNVLRDQQGRWRLSDFRSSALPESGMAAVSLSAVSPQQLAGAPATTADDIYSLGALLYDLLAGHPPFHPDITAERIRSEVPAPLGADGQGQVVPVALTQLVGALLEKTPGRRPGSLGAIRALLADIATEAVRPPARLAPAGQYAGPDDGSPTRRRPAASPAGRLPVLVVGGLIALLASVFAVVFWLPAVVSERGPLVAPVARPKAAAPAAPVAAATPPPQDLRALADAALAERVRAEDAARLAGADRWGGADWLEARRLADLGDTQFGDRDFAAAAASFNQAAGRFRPLADGAPAALAAALQAGQEAYARAEQPAAIAAFERALLIRPGEPAATRGLARSQQLDRVLSAMAEATTRESAGDMAGARAAYNRVLKVDADWAPARAALARLDAGRAASEFERAMAQGLAALAAGRTTEARSAFNLALALRPGDAGARSGLEQLDGDERRGRLAGLQTEAERLVAAERWAEAADQYGALLNLDATLAVAQAGLASAGARAELHRRLEQQLANGDRFNDDTVVAVAQAVVSDAEAVPTKGPLLTGQISRLKFLLAAAARPVTVRLESDNLTSVVIYKVGDLGAFTSRAVELRPGTYVIVGTRDGYRDVRRTVRISADGGQEPINVRCEESI
jgi:hypothetical protein